MSGHDCELSVLLLLGGLLLADLNSSEPERTFILGHFHRFLRRGACSLGRILHLEELEVLHRIFLKRFSASVLVRQQASASLILIEVA